MIRFYLQKLVRDKVVEKCLDDPEFLHTEYRTLDKQAFRRELIRKVHEEADEIPLGDDQQDEALKELADLQEVVDALRQAFGFSIEQVQEEMARKKQDNGGFGWDKIFCPDGYEGKTRAELTPDEDAETYRLFKPIDVVRQFLATLE